MDALFVMVWDHLLSPFRSWDAIRGEAKIELKRLEAKNRLDLSREETKRHEILREIEQNKEVTKREALKVIK